MKQQTWALALTVGLLGAGGTSQAALVDAGNGLVYAGYSDWRLASMSVAWAGVPTGSAYLVNDCSIYSEAACRDNELGYMYYYNLGGSFGDNKTGDQTLGSVTLTDIQFDY